MKKENVLWGLGFIIVGILVLVNALGIIEINVFFKGWWTLFIIVPCFVNIFKDNDKTASIIGTVFGILLLLAVRDVINFDLLWKILLPLVLIIIGLSLIFKDKVSDKVKDEIKKLNKNSKDEYTATFSEQDLNFDDEEFKGCELNAIFGGIKCDIKNAKLKDDVVINASSIFGGITLYVPKDVNVKVVSNSIFGGVSGNYNKNKNDKKGKTIYVNATCLFGGVEIK
mgnify:CR=1 FL=1